MIEAASSVGPSARYTVLSANVSRVLSGLRDRSISGVEQKLMNRAADLLRTIVEGARFAERKDAHALAKPRENLFTAVHALAALQNLNEVDEKAKQVTQVFEDLERDLRVLAQGGRVESKRLDLMEKFFDILGEVFYRDVANSSVTHRHPHFDRP